MLLIINLKMEKFLSFKGIKTRNRKYKLSIKIKK